MSELGGYPSALKRLAVAWGLIGSLSAYGFLRVDLDLGAGSMNIGLLGILFSPGLLLARPWARRCLIWFTRFGYVVVAWWFLGALYSGQQAWWLYLVMAGLTLFLLLIQRDVLMRPDVQRLFDPFGRVE